MIKKIGEEELHKFVLISDLHFGLNKNNKDFFKTQIDFFRQHLFTFILEYEIKTVLHLGDFFHDRRNVNIELLHEIENHFLSFFEKYEIKLISLLGNHDIYYKNSLYPNGLSIYKEKFKQLIIVDSPLYIGENLLIPWIIPEKNEEWKKHLKSNVKRIFGHFDIKGFELMPGVQSIEGFEMDIFNPNTKIFSGHYHKHQKKNNIEYVGSPFHQDWKSKNQKRGFLFIENEKEIFIENKESRKYIQIQYEKEIKIKENLITNNHIRIMVKNEDLTTLHFISFREKIESLNPFNFEILSFEDEEFEIDEETTINIAELNNLFDFEAVSIKYLETMEIPKNLNKKKLISIFNQILLFQNKKEN